jgi:hypothetical protein
VGLIGRILSFVRASRNGAQVSDLKMDPGGGPNLTAEHFAPPGDDSFPLNTDYVYAGPTPQRGRFAAVGYIDPKNAPKARPGEKRTYSRDAAGAVVADHWLKSDGTVVAENAAGSTTLAPDGSFEAENGNGSVTLAADGSILGQNAAGSFELQAGGDFVVNGVVITPAGLITTPTGIVAPSALVGGVEVSAHNHAQPNDSGGNTESPTGPMQ